MAPKSWDAGHELHALRERMSRLFEEELPGQGPAGTARAGAFSPATDVYLTEDAVVVTVELPGVDPAEVAIRCEGLVLTISGERPPSSDGHCHQIERKSGPFLRSLLLPPGVRGERRRVKFEDGLLTVELPREPEL
jgi:HSP20 family protein